MSWLRRHPAVAALCALAVAGLAFWIWRERREREADRAEISSLEIGSDMQCDFLADDFDLLAGALEHPGPPGMNQNVYSLADDGSLVAPQHLAVVWHQAFLTCGFSRDWSEPEHDAAVTGFLELATKAAAQRGPELAATLRALEARVKKVRALPFRRTRR